MSESNMKVMTDEYVMKKDYDFRKAFVAASTAQRNDLPPFGLTMI